MHRRDEKLTFFWRLRIITQFDRIDDKYDVPGGNSIHFYFGIVRAWFDGMSINSELRDTIYLLSSSWHLMWFYISCEKSSSLAVHIMIWKWSLWGWLTSEHVSNKWEKEFNVQDFSNAPKMSSHREIRYVNLSLLDSWALKKRIYSGLEGGRHY